MPNQMRPIHPGEVLKGEMEELGLSARAHDAILRDRRKPALPIV